MKIVVYAFTILAALTSCRTTVGKNVSQIKNSADCSADGPLSGLRPGGLFASKVLYMTQSDIPSGVVHPSMVEVKKSSATQTFRSYGPVKSADAVAASVASLTKRALALPGSDISGGGSEEIVLTGKDRRLNVFNANAALMGDGKKIRVDVPPGASAAIVFRGREVRINGLSVAGQADAAQLMFIMPDALAVSIVGETFAGTIIAPEANISLAASFTGSAFGATIHADRVTAEEMYSGCVPSASVLAAVGASTDDTPHVDDNGSHYVPAPKTACAGRIFGGGYDFNLFARGDVTQTATDVQGRVFAGGNGKWTDYSAGDSLSPNASRADIVTNGSVTFTRGATVNGGIMWGTSGALSQVFSLGPQTKSASGIDSDQAFSKLEDLANSLAAKSTKDEPLTDLGGGAFEMKLKGTDPKFNFFKIAADKFKTVRVFSLDAPAQSTAVLTITGASVEISNFDMKLIGITHGRVIVNVPDATTLKVSKIGVEGTLLAPKALLTFDGLITGQVFVKGVTGGGQINLAPFSGCPFDEPTPPPAPNPSPNPSPGPHPGPSPNPGPSPHPTPTPDPCGPTQMGKSPSQMGKSPTQMGKSPTQMNCKK